MQPLPPIPLLEVPYGIKAAHKRSQSPAWSMDQCRLPCFPENRTEEMYAAAPIHTTVRSASVPVNLAPKSGIEYGRDSQPRPELWSSNEVISLGNEYQEYRLLF